MAATIGCPTSAQTSHGIIQVAKIKRYWALPPVQILLNPSSLRNHLDGIPRAPIQQNPVGSAARALGASDAGGGIDFHPAKRRAILVRDPVDTGLHGTAVHADRRPGAARAFLVDDRQIPRRFTAQIGASVRHRLALQDPVI